jgi:hypothetical protein
MPASAGATFHRQWKGLVPGKRPIRNLYGEEIGCFSAFIVVWTYAVCMLLRFACKNFRSLRDEQELSLVATATHEHEENLIPAPSIKGRIVRSAAIYGANASGKTNVIKALGTR